MARRRVPIAVAIPLAACAAGCNALLDVPDPLLRRDDGGVATPLRDGSTVGDATAPADATIDATLPPPDAGFAQLVLDPPAIDLGPVTYGQSGTTSHCTLTNRGTAAAASLAIQIVGPAAADFTASNDCGASLAPGAACQIAILFTPSAAGARTATLTVTSDGGGASGSLAGSGSYAFSDLTDRNRWQTNDLTPLFDYLDAGAPSYAASAFDGRYVYFFPSSSNEPIALRFDTQGAFENRAAGWSTFDIYRVPGMPNTGGPSPVYFSAVFDGRYVYVVPNDSGNGVVRYDTQAPFDAPASWERYDPSATNAALGAFVGGAFDGRYVYFAPFQGAGGSSGIALRYDTHAPSFTDASAWTDFDVTSVNPQAKGFEGALYDGTYVYLVPDYNGTNNDGIVARYDPSGPFASVGSWKTFDTSAVDPKARGYAGAVYDGTYVYFVPFYAGAMDGVVARYEAARDFVDASAWTSFDLTVRGANMVGYQGGVFDGQYLYLAPNTNSLLQASGLVTRFDTRAPFAVGASWSAFDTTQLSDAAVGYSNAAFDGRYVYLVPTSAVFVRFDAKQPAGMPATSHGSFF